MPRDRYGEDDPRDRSPRSSHGLLVGLLVAVGLLALLACGGVGAAVYVARTATLREREAAAERAEAEAARARHPAVGAERRGAAGEDAPDPREAARPPMGKKEFEAAVIGRTRDQVVAAVGEPDAVRGNVYVEERRPGRGGPGTGPNVGWPADYLVYRGRVRDPATGRAYAEAAVRLGPDWVADRVEYK